MPNRLKPNGRGWLWLVLCMVWAASFIYSQTPLNDMVFCLFRRVAELNCAGCGLTRSFTAMSRFEPYSALSHHPAGPLLYGAMVAHIGLDFVRWLRASPTFLPLPRWLTLGFWGFVAIVFAGHLVRTIISWF